MPAFNARPARGPGDAAPVASGAPAPTTRLAATPTIPTTTATTATTATAATAATDPPLPLPEGRASAPRSVTELVDTLFARFDADGSGTLTLSEWLGVVDPDGDPDGDGSGRVDTAGAALMTLDTNTDGALGSAELATALGALDTDGDGQLSRSEHAAARSSDGNVSGVEALLGGWRGGPEEGHSGGHIGGHSGDRSAGPGRAGDRAVPEPVRIGDAVTAILDIWDRDDSGTLAVSELLAALGGHGPAARSGDAGSRLSAALARLDSNTDGALSGAELSAALTAADTNQDGSVGPGEGAPGSDVGLVGVLLQHLGGLPG